MAETRQSAEYDVKGGVKNVSEAGSSISSDEEQAIVKTQIAEESSHQIKYRSCSWQKVSCPLLSSGIVVRVPFWIHVRCRVLPVLHPSPDLGVCWSLCVVLTLPIRLPRCYFRSTSA